MTGSGKTELLRTMLVSLTMSGRRRDTITYLIDPKGRKLAGLAGLRSVMGVCGFEQAPGLLDHLIGAMERRGGWSGESHVYLFIDELADLVLVDRSVEVALTRLVQRGREAGIHVVAATQRPSARVVQGLMRANFPVRVVGAVNSATEAAIATGMARSGAELLLGKGDMVLVHQGKAERFQAAFCSPEDLDQIGHLFIKEVNKSVRAGEPESLTVRLRERLRLRGPGRPAEGPTEGMINWALGRLIATGECSQRALREWHKLMFKSDVNPPRAAAAIQEARRRLELAGKDQGVTDGQ
jgi:DNA segregation ATPase FtsK/SpoIIIE-like protein